MHNIVITVSNTVLETFWTLRRSNQSLLKDINPEYSFTKAEAPKLWPPDAKSWFIGKDLNARKDWRQEEKGVTEDEMVGRHHWLNGHEFEQTPGDGEGQGSLMCCRPWGRKELDMSERLNNYCPCTHRRLPSCSFILLSTPAFVEQTLLPYLDSH